MTYILLIFISLCGIEAAVIAGSDYDYIIVGAGVSGSALAAELSVNNQVLLIEQGGWSSQYPDIIDNANNWFHVITNPQIERGYRSTPQKYLHNRHIPLFRAKITGGSGSENGMSWNLGNKNDFNHKWNINGWRWNDLSSYWHKIQNKFNKSTIKQDMFTQKIINAMTLEHGYKFNPDHNDLDKNGQKGVSLQQYSATKISETYASRQSSWTQCIEPIINRHNLDIITYHRVNKILFNSTTAIGVEVTNIVTNKKYNFYGTQEIILSAGSFDSPKILLLSGVGDCNYLKSKSIKCVSNVIGVGQSLQDHANLFLESPPIKKEIINNITLPPLLFGSDGRVIIFDVDNEFEFVFLLDKFEFIDGIYVYNTPKNELNLQLFCQLLHPRSRGTVKLIDNNPASNPLIDINFLSDKYDEKYVVDLIKKGRQLLYSNGLSDLYENINDEIMPGINVQSDDEILEWSRSVMLTTYHPVGTCKMGNSFDDEMVVVDNRLRVKGINNLRVVDVSIMPQIVSAHTNAAAVLIGFRAADIILQDNSNQQYNDKKTEL
eukprot:546913_1